MKKYVLTVMLWCASGYAISEGICTSSGCISVISTLYTTVDGLIYIGTPGDETKANCTPVSDTFFTLNTDGKNSDEVYSSLLSAYVSGKAIQLRIKENSSPCEIAYVRLDAAYEN